MNRMIATTMSAENVFTKKPNEIIIISSFSPRGVIMWKFDKVCPTIGKNEHIIKIHQTMQISFQQGLAIAQKKVETVLKLYTAKICISITSLDYKIYTAFSLPLFPWLF